MGVVWEGRGDNRERCDLSESRTSWSEGGGGGGERGKWRLVAGLWRVAGL